VSESAARFILDNLPLKQIKIESDYSSGRIDKNEANLCIEKLIRESDYYGAMDSAGKLISGCAKAYLLSNMLTLITGIFINSQLRGLDIRETLINYIPLSASNCIISLFSAILLSTSMGVDVKRNQTLFSYYYKQQKGAS